MRLFIVFFTICIGLQANAALMLSDQQAAEIGREMYQKITSEMPVYKAPKLNEYITMVGQRIVQNSDEPDGNYTFTILDNADINAFATPGGYIYINRGLLAYMNSEAQLAAVLSHELAHITAQHAARQKRAQTGSNVVAGVFAILTGSMEVGEASAMWGSAAVSGYGRDMELEADSIGAKTLARAGYPPQAMIEIISQLKDHERFMKKRSKDSGKTVQTYHGLFSTHPRNDKRLLEMVKQSDENSHQDPRVAPFRVATEGLPWGQTSQTTPQREDRYYDNKLNFTFDYPQGWQFKKDAARIIGQPVDRSATLSIEIKARTVDTPDIFIKKILGINFIRKSEPIVVSRLNGHTGVVPGKNGASDTRLAVLYYGRRAFVFTGNVIDGSLDKTTSTGNPANNSTDTYDKQFKSIIGSFQPRSSRRRANRSAPLHYVKASSAATYAKLARQLNLGKYGADELRLINGDYPGGEPRAGQWIKIIR
ncbi:MAG: peptidase M48 [Gammaproteobacteria bacterium]|nr:MAG: peptidase M48 [Gammaproteobacteria bacterium]RLA46629.1 MAG: peptidase M48 [Gammaproteobacteria bacterium]